MKKRGTMNFYKPKRIIEYIKLFTLYEKSFPVSEKKPISMILKMQKCGATDIWYFEEDGIVVYHVNASLYKEVYEGETFYDVYYNNTDVSEENGYGTEENLIELVNNTTYGYTYGVGESLSSSVKTDAGEKIAYTFTVEALTADSATVIFRKNA